MFGMGDPIEEQIRKIEEEQDPLKAIRMLASLLRGIHAVSCMEMKNMQEFMDKIGKILLGNGRPETALMTRVSNMETSLEEIAKALAGFSVLISGDLADGGTQPGWLAEMSQVKNVTDVLKRVGWLVFSSIIVNVVAIVVAFVLVFLR